MNGITDTRVISSHQLNITFYKLCHVLDFYLKAFRHNILLQMIVTSALEANVTLKALAVGSYELRRFESHFGLQNIKASISNGM